MVTLIKNFAILKKISIKKNKLLFYFSIRHLNTYDVVLKKFKSIHKILNNA